MVFGKRLGCIFAFMAVFLMLVSVSTAEIEDQILLKGIAIDITTNEALPSLALILDGKNLDNGEISKNIIYLNQYGAFQQKFSPGNWVFDLMLYSPLTEEISYYTQRAINIQKTDQVLERNFYMTPVGALEGTVLDDSERLAINADLDFKCKKNEKIVFPVKTDKFGAFDADFVPAGKCRISAAYNNQVGVADVIVEKGKTSSVVIRLNKKVITSNTLYFVVGGIALLLIIILLYIVLKRRLKRKIMEIGTKNSGKQDGNKKVSRIKKIIIRKEAKEVPSAQKDIKSNMGAVEPEQQEANEAKTEVHENEKHELNPRARDIIKTLNEKENKVVQCIINNTNNNNQPTQASIRNTTGIPKTTLVRAFQSLEAKRVIIIEKIGKMKKISLTDWFLGKD